MKLIASWDDIEIIICEKQEDIFINRVVIENIEEVQKHGFPLFYLKELKVITSDIPYMIKRRIMADMNMINTVEKKLSDEDILKYIKVTRCIRPTDKFSINVEI